MFTIDTAMNAEIDYRANRVRADWAPRRHRSIRRDRGTRATTTGR